jgi:predicted ester cyclase
MAAAEPSVQEANKALVRHYLEEIYRGNLDILDEVISEEYVGTTGHTPPAQYRANFVAIRRAFPDIQIRFDSLIAEGDWVAMHCTIEGTHLGEWRGIPPTGKHATWTATAFRRVRDGKIVQGYATWGWLSFLQQIGATVTPPSPAPEGTEERPPHA